jgi:phage I-like protein
MGKKQGFQRVVFQVQQLAGQYPHQIIAARKRQIQVPAGPGGGTFMFNEAIMATVAAWVPKSYDAFRDGTFEMTFNSSIEEGVYKFTNVGLNV